MIDNQKETPMPRMIDADKQKACQEALENWYAVNLRGRRTLAEFIWTAAWYAALEWQSLQHQASAVPSGVGERERLRHLLTRAIGIIGRCKPASEDEIATRIVKEEAMAIITPPATEQQPARAEEAATLADKLLQIAWTKPEGQKRAAMIEALRPYLRTQPAQQPAPLDLESEDVVNAVVNVLLSNFGSFTTKNDQSVGKIAKKVLQAIRDFQAKASPVAEKADSSPMTADVILGTMIIPGGVVGVGEAVQTRWTLKEDGTLRPEGFRVVQASELGEESESSSMPRVGCWGQGGEDGS